MYEFVQLSILDEFNMPIKKENMNVLIACEESQEVCKAFREKGHNAFSCDLQECSGGHPEWHIFGDCTNYLNGDCSFKTMSGDDVSINGKWDLIIAHPPCTYISNAGARHLYPDGILNEQRLKEGIKATHLFFKCLWANCDHIAVENPVPSSVYCLPKCDQIIEPWMFGHPYQKKTCLWLKGLPRLQPTYICRERENTKVPGNWFNSGGSERQKNRSKTFPGIAKAMAEQWG